MNKLPALLRDQLLEVQARLRRQIEILDLGPSYIRTPDSTGGLLNQAAALRAVLADIDAQLADLNGEEPPMADQA